MRTRKGQKQMAKQKARFDNYADATTVLRLKGPDQIEKHVLHVLLLCRNRWTGKCCPGQRALAEWLGLSKTSITRALKRLSGRGLIVNTSRAKQSPNYLICLDALVLPSGPDSTLKYTTKAEENSKAIEQGF